ncbi:MAG: methylated-DNA--[protein]-cysteine S-methyltransferase [Solirubrobacterales bacterium]
MTGNITKRDVDRALGELRTGAPAEAVEAAARRFAAAAEREGLVDVAYASEDSPFGPLLLAATGRGLVMVSLPNHQPDSALERLAAEVSPRVLEAPARLDPVRRELDLYFAGELEEFDLPLDWSLTAGFRRRVLRATARIPYGETRSYTEMARSAGNERAQRAAGSALGSNPIPIVVPCHRVLRAGGALGGYGGGLEMKEALLRMEGALER